MAVDCALYDLAAQNAEQPLWRYLGGASGEVQTDMTLSVEPRTDALLAAAREHADAGFGTLKVKIGAAGPGASQLAALREAVGAATRIRVDANQAWAVEQAVDVVRQAAALGVDLEFVEQPVHRDDVTGLVAVAERLDVPVLADESVWTVRQLRELLAVGRVAAVNIKLAKSGGLREALELARLARENGLGVVVGCMLESHVGIAAAAALAAAVATPDESGSPRAQDLDGGLWLAQSPVEGGLRYDGPRLLLPEAPGLGIAGIR
jgi:L-alanine-DL-glutamate epimerase-like enolase superfamily enzyme